MRPKKQQAVEKTQSISGGVPRGRTPMETHCVGHATKQSSKIQAGRQRQKTRWNWRRSAAGCCCCCRWIALLSHNINQIRAPIGSLLSRRSSQRGFFIHFEGDLWYNFRRVNIAESDFFSVSLTAWFGFHYCACVFQRTNRVLLIQGYPHRHHFFSPCGSYFRVGFLIFPSICFFFQICL